MSLYQRHPVNSTFGLSLVEEWNLYYIFNLINIYNSIIGVHCQKIASRWLIFNELLKILDMDISGIILSPPPSTIAVF